MSRTHLRRFVALVLLAGGVAWSGRAALAGAASLDDLLTGALAPSSAPALLGPITSAGRIGWECKPERAAAAAPWRKAELPSDSSTP